MPISLSFLLFLVAVVLWIVLIIRRGRAFPDSMDVVILLLIAFYVGTMHL